MLLILFLTKVGTLCIRVVIYRLRLSAILTIKLFSFGFLVNAIYQSIQPPIYNLQIMSLFAGISLHQCATYCIRFKNCDNFGYQSVDINSGYNDICTMYTISSWYGNKNSGYERFLAITYTFAFTTYNIYLK